LILRRGHLIHDIKKTIPKRTKTIYNFASTLRLQLKVWATSAGLSDNIRFLSLIPYTDVVQLMRQSIAVVQPSLYEGWSTTVEECKVLSKPILLSRIQVHEEQAPKHGTFVDKNNPSDLAEQFVRLWKSGASGPNFELETQSRSEIIDGLCAFGNGFLDIVDEVTSPEYQRKGLVGKRCSK
jgi:glycosyltransferase involved in cell wall biosynthesis